MNKKELEALVEEQKETIDAKQSRIKELDEQITDVQRIIHDVFELGISTRAQRRQWIRAYTKWFYSKQGQAICQLKIEINRLTYQNAQLRSVADEYIETMTELIKTIESLKVQNEMD